MSQGTPSDAVLTFILLLSSSVQNATLETIGLLAVGRLMPELGMNLFDLSKYPMVPSSRIYNHCVGIGSLCDFGSLPGNSTPGIWVPVEVVWV